MNALYNWTNDEIMVTERMKDIRREADQVRLLHRAGLANTAERLAVALGNTLVNLGEYLRRKYTHPNQIYRTTSGKYAV